MLLTESRYGHVDKKRDACVSCITMLAATVSSASSIFNNDIGPTAGRFHRPHYPWWSQCLSVPSPLDECRLAFSLLPAPSNPSYGRLVVFLSDRAAPDSLGALGVAQGAQAFLVVHVAGADTS